MTPPPEPQPQQLPLQRGLGWLHVAGMLYYLCHPENGDIGPPAVQDELVEIFIMLADAAYVLPNIIEHNVIWKDYEKDLFPDDYCQYFAQVVLRFINVFALPDDCRDQVWYMPVVADRRITQTDCVLAVIGMELKCWRV
jgi:hypothetical protein